AQGMGDVGEFSNITWSPDGKSVVFSGLKEGHSDLYQYFLDTEELVQLTDDLHSEYHPSFSRSGDQLVFSSDRGSFARDQRSVDISFTLSVMDLATRTIRNLPVFPGAN